MEERRMQMAITPQLIAMAKQVRAMLAQYPENSPTAFILKSSEQYQKMKEKRIGSKKTYKNTFPTSLDV